VSHHPRFLDASIRPPAHPRALALAAVSWVVGQLVLAPSAVVDGSIA